MGKLFTNLKKRVAILTVLCMMLTLAPSPAFATTVSDISGHWAQTTIQSWVDNGLIKGYPDGTFKPDNNITRAEFITLVNRAFEYTNTAPISFTDVNQNAWYASAIGVAVEAGYISGYPDGTMKPENPISREEAATIIMRIKNLVANPAAVSVYTDASSITWGKGEVGAVTAAKIMQGYPDGSFMPRGLITRAETVIALDNAMKYVAGSVTPLAPSVTRNDDTNTVSGMTTAMEYKLDSANYATYVASAFNALDFSGNHTLLVRFAALGINPFGPATTLTFTTNIGGGGGGGGNGDGSNDTAVSAINITGSAVVGATLTAIGLLPTDATVSYQWEISTDGAIYADIALATGITYTPVAGDAGKYIKVSATGTGSYDGTVTSAATGPVLTEADVDTTTYDAIVLTVPADNADGTYTDPSWTLFAAATYDLTLAATDGQAALDAEVTAIQEALDLLELVADVDTTTYDAIVLTVPADNADGTYTDPSWTLFAAATYDLTLAATDGQAALDAEVTAIQEALDLLELVADLTAYNLALAAVDEADYTTATWATYQIVVLANVMTDQDTQADVDTATGLITTAQGDLVLKLAAYNAALAAVNQEDYTTVSWSTYAGIVAANPVSNQSSQVMIDAVTGVITAAQADLVAIADMTEYDAALTTVTEAAFTTATWTTYAGIVAANVVDEQDTQVAVDAATLAITTAQEDLVAIADMTEYDAALTTVTEAAFTTASWTTYAGIVAANVVTDQNTQAEVTTATDNITLAQDGLVTLLDEAVAKITVVALGPITVGDTATVLEKAQALVGVGFTVTVEAADGTIISAAGVATEAGAGTISFTVTENATPANTADTATFNITVYPVVI